MFLKVFKNKSNQKYVNNLLANRKRSVNAHKVVKIGVIIHLDEFDNSEGFRVLFKELGLTSPKHKVVGFIDDDKFEGSQWETIFSPKDFGWKGKINNIDLQDFLNEEYDVLISYYNKRNLYLDWMTAASEANLKVGLTRDDERLHDLIFYIDVKAFKTFKVEFKKYLNILQKL